MPSVLFLFLIVLCLVMLGRGLVIRGQFYQFPFFAAGIFASFIIPQFPGLISNPFLPEPALSKTLFFAILCLGMCWLGWNAAVGRKERSTLIFSEKRLLQAAVVLTAIGSYFFYKFGQLPDDVRLRGNLSGTAVSYLFFAKLLTYGFALGLLCYMRRPSKLSFLIVLIGAAFYFERIVLAGRRGETAEFFLLVGLAVWFQTRWAPPRPAVVMGLLLSVVGMLGAEQYRAATYYTAERDWASVLNIDLAENWNRLLENGGPEVMNAVVAIETTDRKGEFDFGMDHWNSLVFAYVPAQLVGPTVKQALLINVLPDFERDYVPTHGSTYTGLTDAFASFWYFGCAKFFLLGFVLSWLYGRAILGDTIAQLLYMLSAVPSILAITHFTNEIVIAWVHIAVFLGPVMLYARIPAPGRSRKREEFSSGTPVGYAR